MNVLWILAHPDARSLNGSLHRAGLAALTDAGHHVEVSDLYAMKWNPLVDREDYAPDRAPAGPPAGTAGATAGDTATAAAGDTAADAPGGVAAGERLRIDQASQRALDGGTLSADILAEQAKLDRADLVVTQFPLWWGGVPAILKGWIDRVFVRGYAYGIPDPDRPGRSLRYGTGGLAGKRALAVVTIGAGAHGYGPRGIDGSLDDVLFPLLHGTFFYTGMSVLPPVAVYGANHLSDEGFRAAETELRERLAGVRTAPPIPYRTQNGGDYDDHMVLRPHVAAGSTGLDAHRA